MNLSIIVKIHVSPPHVSRLTTQTALTDLQNIFCRSQPSQNIGVKATTKMTLNDQPRMTEIVAVPYLRPTKKRFFYERATDILSVRMTPSFRLLNECTLLKLNHNMTHDQGLALFSYRQSVSNQSPK